MPLYPAIVECYSFYDWPVDMHIRTLLKRVPDSQLTIKARGPLVDNFICLFIKISIVYILLGIGWIIFYFFKRVSAWTQQSLCSPEITPAHDPLLGRLIDRWCVRRVSVLRVCWPFEIHRWYIIIYHIEFFSISFINRFHRLLLLYFVIIQLEHNLLLDYFITEAGVLVGNPGPNSPIP